MQHSGAVIFLTGSPARGHIDGATAIGAALRIGTGAGHLRTSMRATGFASAPNPPVWDRANNEIVIFKTSTTHTEQFGYDFNFFFCVSFDQIEIIRGKQAVGVLNTFAGIVEASW